MKYLLDTCSISDFVKNDLNTVKHVQNTSPAEIAISSITVMELEYGLLHDPIRTKKLKPIIQALVSSIIILPYTEEDANYSAFIRAAMRKAGTPIGSYDVLIAGVALRYQLILVTANEKEFQRVPKLVIENWRF
ncbi:MAG TPA: type II toxin-antitoxin system VapC family toxin [Coxiellaceae bacterium]|nr:MAG: twitching motility protein PilT [Gammaproteobacteria bacterium RIFCSPHIGHO2_12_FULL_36_30]HLB55840.1 type II toxin-antitoxin system VapC family toxin [Coxiellaceae bacterium]